MTHRRTWQKLETKTAKLLKGERNPLSGENSKHTSGDVIHPSLYVECKLKKRIATWSLFREVEEQAKLEGKTPVLILKEKNKKGELAVLRLSDLVELVDRD
jgi:hypothetical protein